MPELSEKDRARRRASNKVRHLLGDPHQKLFAYCERCQHSGELNLRMIAERYGADLTIDRLIRKLRCLSCQSRKAVVRRVYDPAARTAEPGEDGAPWLR